MSRLLGVYYLHDYILKLIDEKRRDPAALWKIVSCRFIYICIDYCIVSRSGVGARRQLNCDSFETIMK